MVKAKNQIVPLVLVAVLVLAGSFRPAYGITSQEIMNGIQEKYKGLTSLRADYTRTTTTPAMEGVFRSSSEQTASGYLLFRKPARLVLNQSSPQVETMVTDGKTVWWYIPEEKTVYRYAQVDVYGELKPLLDFFNGLGSLDGDFSVKIEPAAKAGQNHRLDLTRIREGSGPSTITVWCAPKSYTIVGFKLVSLTGESTLFNLSNVKVDPDIKADAFEFRIPSGVQVIDQ